MQVSFKTVLRKEVSPDHNSRPEVGSINHLTFSKGVTTMKTSKLFIVVVCTVLAVSSLLAQGKNPVYSGHVLLVGAAPWQANDLAVMSTLK
jgi:hypothetical protein